MVKGLDIKFSKSIEFRTWAVKKISSTPYKSYANVQAKAF